MQIESLFDDMLFVGTHGHVAALRKSDGQLLWKGSLPKTGYQVVSLILEDGLLLCASGGRVFALAPADGRILWQNDLKGMGTGRVVLATARQPAPAPIAGIEEEAEEEQASTAST